MLILLFLLFVNFSLLSQVVAVIDTHKIFMDEFKNRYTDFLISSGAKDNIAARNGILNNIINEKILFYFDDNKKIFENINYLKELNWNKKQAALAFLKDQEIYAKISVTDDELRKTFIRVNEHISARHLFSLSEEEANGFYKLLKAGVSFESIAKEIFTDSTLKNNGGYLDYFTWGDMDPNFEEAAFSLKVGEISQPVKTAYGYSIIKLEDRKPNPLLTESEFVRKKNHIEQILKIKKKKPSEKKYMDELISEMKFLFNDKSLQNILAEIKDYFSGKIEKSKNKNDKLFCVEVNEQKFSQTDVGKKLFDIPDYHLRKINSVDQLKAVIKGLFLQDALLSIAEKKQYDKNIYTIDALKKLDGITFFEYKSNEITNDTTIPDSSIINYYLQNINQFSSENEVNLQQILVADLSLAEIIAAQAKQNSDFTSLVKKYSIDEQAKKSNGIIGFTPISRLGKISEKIWNSAIGEIVGPFKIENKFAVLKLIGKQESKPIPFNSIKDFVVNAIKKENQLNLVLEHINSIRKKINIKIFEDCLTNFNLEKTFK